jgi:hypothetical protein
MNGQKAPPKLHAWLGRHKIIFETVAVTVFTFASIFVAILQWHTAEKQADISKRQSLPNFVIATHRVRSQGQEEPSLIDDELHVQNFGGPARALEHQITTFLRFTTLTKGDSAPNRTDVQLNGYYNSTRVTNDAVTGLLIKSWGHGNDQQLENLLKEIQELAGKKGYICIVELARYIKLTYSDLFDQNHAEYFFVPTVGVASRISAAEGRGWVDAFYEEYQWEDVPSDRIDLGRSTAQEVWDRAMPEQKRK